MIIVADSGSTKTDWKIKLKNGESANFTTIGMNPFFISSAKVITELLKSFPKHLSISEISQVNFYGAGCSGYEKKEIIETALNQFFVNANISVESDLLGAAKALFDNKSGIAVILGTGSNTCMYSGGEIIKNVSSLGYILGDEGSGSYIGKHFIKSYLDNNLPKTICDKFYSSFNLSTADILDKIYKQSFPNKFLASFTKFVSQNIDDKSMYDIVRNSFVQLFKVHITKYDNYKIQKIRCVGSIAYYFQDILKSVAKDYDAEIDMIIKAPIHNL